MKPILDRFTQSTPASFTFRPGTRQDLFALRLAVKLNDAAAASHYATLLADYSEGQMLAALRRALKSSSGANLAKSFHVELSRSYGNGSNGKFAKLIAVRVERRSVAVAIFFGDHLEYADVRHLSSTKDKALESAIVFIEWIADQFPVDSAALELIPAGNEIQRRGTFPLRPDSKSIHMRRSISSTHPSMRPAVQELLHSGKEVRSHQKLA